MSLFVWRSLLAFGVVALLHSLISAAQQVHSTLDGGVQLDIVIECLFGAILSSFSFVKISTCVVFNDDGVSVSKSSPTPGLIVDGWKDIDATKAIANSKITVESLNNRVNFVHFNHRAKILYNQQDGSVRR